MTRFFGVAVGVVSLVLGAVGVHQAVTARSLDAADLLLAPAARGDTLLPSKVDEISKLLMRDGELVDGGGNGYGRLALHRAIRTSGDERHDWALASAAAFEAALVARPNSPDVWRRLLTARLLAGGDDADLVRLIDAVLLFEAGEPGSVLLLGELMVRAPRLFSETALRRLQGMLAKMETANDSRLALASMVARLEPELRGPIIRLMRDETYFTDLVGYFERKQRRQ
ncbi:hypothetical protein [Pyruvatibacter mobilis]|uniref:hypothetical protein n=1 Tax=Pyruvatibacter mobilis TaxID=1712261 RepID=UPI003C79E6B5